MAVAAAENFQLKWHSYGAYMHSSVATLLRSESFSDITLATVDGRQIHAHRFVLSACSSYLHQLLRVVYPGTNSSVPVVIVLPSDISYRILKVLIEYMYSGEATVSYGQLDGILKAAHILGIRGLCREGNSADRNTNASSHKQVQNENNPSRFNKQVSSDFPRIRITGNNNERNQESTRINTSRDDKDSSQAVQGRSEECSTSDVAPNDDSEENKRDSNRPTCADNGKPTHSTQSDTSESGPVQLLVKQEPIEWVDTELEEPGEEDEDLSERMHTETTVKPELEHSDNQDDDDDDDDDKLYTPLTCDICQKTFSAPAEWVRHFEAHPEIYQQSNRHRSHKNSEDADSAEQTSDFPPLRCDLCELVFASPGDWVRHIQNSHTEQELAISNNSYQHSRIRRSGRKLCQVCNKTFPSYASMMIHRRTHTGEKPYVCPICSKGFNVKSNLLRHLRTLHDQIVSPSNVD